jgi:hypothetical protein
MAWRVAEALLTLRSEIDKLHPDRSKLSDGTIGNASHQTRVSDHNPWVKDGAMGVVTAMDVTHDPDHGVDCWVLAEIFRNLGESGDKRVKYVIWHKRIASSVADWRWRPYEGANTHEKHVHLSVSFERQFYDSRRSWLPKPVVPVSNDELVDMFIGVYPTDGRIFLVGFEGKRQITRAVADELKPIGIPERKVSSALLNVFPTLSTLKAG